jgi:hypothetical protein
MHASPFTMRGFLELRRKGHLQGHARRSLDQLGRRWPTDPNVYYVLLVIVLVIVLILAF